VRHALAVSPVAWLLSLPYAVEILGQTRVDPATWTEVSTTAIYYKDWETRRIRRSFTCQFHPELMADIRDVGGRQHATRNSKATASGCSSYALRDAGVAEQGANRRAGASR
jgi:hypothetical protein